MAEAQNPEGSKSRNEFWWGVAAAVGLLVVADVLITD